MNKERDFKAELERLKQAYPDLELIPDEVATAMSKGEDAVEAYEAWKRRETDKQKPEQAEGEDFTSLKERIKALERENQVLKQNARAASRAIGGGVGPTRVNERKDDFLVGLGSDEW